MSPTLGHPGALRRLTASHPEASKAKAVAMVTIPATSLWAGEKGIEPGVTYLLTLFSNRLVLIRPVRRPSPDAVLAEFPRKGYRITDVKQDLLNLSFSVVLPYGRMTVKMGRRGPYGVNTEVLAAVVASAAAAERAVARTGEPGPLVTAGDVTVFARMCAAHGPGAETATAVAEARLRDDASGRAGTKRPPLLLAALPDRVLLLDAGATTHVPSTPLATFRRGSCTVEVNGTDRKYVDLTLADGGRSLAVRVSRYGDERIDRLVLDAVLAVGS